jgi:hypothetical protein
MRMLTVALSDTVQPIFERVNIETLSYSAVKIVLARSSIGWVAAAAAADGAAAHGWDDAELLDAIEGDDDDEWSQPSQPASQPQQPLTLAPVATHVPNKRSLPASFANNAASKQPKDSFV